MSLLSFIAQRGTRTLAAAGPLERCQSLLPLKFVSSRAFTTTNGFTTQIFVRRRLFPQPLNAVLRQGGKRAYSNPTGSSPVGFIQKYNRLLDTNPIATKGVTSAVIGFLGDVACQRFFDDGHPYDLRRSVTFGALGILLVGPALHKWYGILGRYFASGTTAAALGQLACDQLLFGPLFMGLFMSTLMTLVCDDLPAEGRAADVPVHLQQHWPEAVVANWVVWVPANFVNFRYVPIQYRVMYNNAIGAFWGIYMSYISHISLQH